ncbi:MAG TPA: 16S rRNA (guanine(966)-N(2))-methyltransferase RsmD [Polyangia bacterium]|jgi:16S rRNA (guanine966-N2)-methyltransferase
MRIIAGTAGGRRLRTPRGDATRPTADRVREALFNILLARGPAPERVLDLYAGTGALGLEALSRGAHQAVFVDEAEDAIALISENALALGFSAACQPVRERVHTFLKRPPAAPFGWIFLDPPYATRPSEKEMDRALALLGAGRWLAPDGVVVAEHEWRTAPAERHGALALSDRRRYGQTAVSIFTCTSEEP